MDVLHLGALGLQYILPPDTANINHTKNVCTCLELSNLVAGGDPCVKTVEDNPEVLDITSCNIKTCYDGLQDNTRVE